MHDCQGDGEDESGGAGPSNGPVRNSPIARPILSGMSPFVPAHVGLLRELPPYIDLCFGAGGFPKNSGESFFFPLESLRFCLVLFSK
jgi:hypothetical protein